MIKVILADDHQMFIDGMKSFLEKEKEIQIVGEALNGKQVLKILENQKADVVVLDIRMPEMGGEKTLKILKKKYPKTKVLILTMHDQPNLILKFIHEKANGYLLKDRSKEELVGAIHALYKNNSYYPIGLMNIVTEGSYRPEEQVDFTPRELEVLKLIATGKTDKEIAEKLFISETTVMTHCRNLRKKVHVSNRVQLAIYAKDHDLA